MAKIAIKTARLGAMSAGVAALSACVAGGLNESAKPPELTPINNPAEVVGRAPVSMPLPLPDTQQYASNSLWRTGARSFFDDQRADAIGDILTVNIEISDRAQVNNTTSRSRSNSEDVGVSAALGLEQSLLNTLPAGTTSVDPAIAFDSTTASNGTGTVNRAETINLTVAAVITDVMPNGNLVIGGSQEVKVNNEVRELLVSGVIRPEDIGSDNTISHTQIAQARISYGGRGDLTAVQRSRYGTRVYEQIAPF